MSHNPVLVPVLEIGTAVEAALDEEAHFVLVQVHFADVVAAHLAVGGLRLFLGHVDSPLVYSEKWNLLLSSIFLL